MLKKSYLIFHMMVDVLGLLLLIKRYTKTRYGLFNFDCKHPYNTIYFLYIILYL